MRTFALFVTLIAAACLADTVLKNAGTRLGPILVLDCSADAGVNCTRTASTGTGNVRCSSASATELGCVSTGTQTMAGTKTFTGGVRTTTLGGADGGIYAKLSTGSSLVSAGFFSAYAPPEFITTRDTSGRLVGVLGYGTGSTTRAPGPIHLTGFTGLPVVTGTTDGGVAPDGGVKDYKVSISVSDDAGVRTDVCSAYGSCDWASGSVLHMTQDLECGLDGGGNINQGGLALVLIDDPECYTSPGLNITVEYTGLQ